jgi:MFS family permease
MVFQKLHLSPINACMAVVILCVMIDLLGLSLSIPILANYARDVQGNAPGCPIPGQLQNASLYMKQYNSKACQQATASIKANTGYLTSAYSAAMLISTIWMPIFSDKYGPRSAIIVSIFGSILGFLGQALTCPTLESNPNSTCIGIPGGFGMLVAVRALGGLFGGTATVAAAFIVLLYKQKQRGAQFAKMSACALSAFVFGPFVGGGLAQFGLRVPLYVATALSTCAMFLAIKFVLDPNELMKQERNNNNNNKDNTDKVRASLTNAAPKEKFVAWKEIRIWLIAAQTMFTTLAFNGLSSLIALVLLEDRLGVVLPTDTVETQGKKVALWVMAYVPALGATQVIVVMGLFPRMTKRVGLLQTGMIGSMFIAVALFLIPFYNRPALLFITQILLALGNGLQSNVSNTYLSKFAPKGKAAQTLAYGSMADTIGNILGPQLTQIYLLDATWPFYIAALFGVCSAVVLLVLVVIGSKPHDDHRPEVIQARKRRETELLNGMTEDLKNNPLLTRSGEPGNERKEDDVGMNSAETNSAVVDGHDGLVDLEQKMDEMNISNRVHPACFVTGETSAPHHVKYSTEAMNELSSFLYEELLDKQHMWGLRSGKRIVRQRALEAHKDMLSMGISRIPPPNDQDNDKAFREGVALFLSDTGHGDWAMNIPGIDLDSVLNTFRVSSI